MASEMKVSSCEHRPNLSRTEEPPPRRQMGRDFAPQAGPKAPQAIFAKSQEERELRLQLAQAKGEGLKDRLIAAKNEEKLRELEKKLQQESTEKNELMERFLKTLAGQVESQEENRTAQFNVSDLKTDMANLQEKLKAFDARITTLNEELEKCRIYRGLAAELQMISREILNCEIGILENLLRHGAAEKTTMWAGSWFGPFGAALASFIPGLSPYNPFRDTMIKEMDFRSSLLKKRDALVARHPELCEELVLPEAVSPYLTHIRSLFGIR